MDGKAEPEAEPVEFPEWELLHNSDEPLDFAPEPGSDDSSPLIKHDYFSLNPDTIIPNSSSNSNSSTDPSEVDRNFDDSYVANQLFPEGELHLMKQPSSSSSTSSNPQIWHDSDSDSDAKMTSVVVADTTITTTTSELLDVTGSGSGSGAVGFDSKEEEEEEEEVEQLVESRGLEEDKEEKEKRRMVWWKVPFEVFKYWVIRVSPVPVWSLSVAATAAFLGLVILGRRLYKMKRKTQTLKLNVALDDKKVSQLMGRVARLNEAFSVVRRVPIVRPSLPASSVTLRPVMSMR